MTCLCKTISSCSEKINTLTPGSPREDPTEPVSFDLFFLREALQSGQVSLGIWRFLRLPGSEASLVWKVLDNCVGCMDGRSRAGSVL